MILTFIHKVRTRLNTGLALRCLLTSLLGAAAITIGIGLSYIFRGYAVPVQVYYALAPVTVLAAAVSWFIRRRNDRQAASFADHHFHLKDSLSTSLEFTGKEEDIYTLQRKQTETAIQPLSDREVPLFVSRKLLIGSLVALSGATALAFVPPSQEVLDRQEEERITRMRTDEIQREMEKTVEEMIQSLDEDEKEALKPEELRKWVKQLKETADKREALRNYARLEQKIQKSIDQLEQRKSEELLKNAGLKLEKASEMDTKEMGKKLKDKDYKKAAEELKKFKLSNKDQKDPKIDKDKPKSKELDTKDFKEARKKIDKQKLADRQKKLAKLRSLSKRLAEAARQQKGQAGNGNNAKEGNNANGKFAEGDPGAEMTDQELDELLEDLDMAAEELEEMLEQFELDLEKGENPDGEEMEELMGRIDRQLGQFQKRMMQMHGRRKARSRLQQLARALGLAQSYANGQCDQLNMRGQGGKKPGIGTDNRTRKEKDKLTDNGLYDKLKGQKGNGQSLSSIEEAESGSGTSGRTGEARQREFQQQMSSFVERDDIPDDMKAGVKEYFKNIHRNTADPNNSDK
ncbi:hypothetical protein Rhal01_02960 [Rubritalea halochordaticola]|uniref:EF-hand domain-containing protein n=1 Tax=Rubritalea halochordaticola TaxID=714537 RepID=A0ABP9V457_9BACT